MGISTLDIGVIVLMLVAMIRGYVRGFVTEIMSTAAPLLGILGGALLSRPFSGMFSFLSGSDNPLINQIVAFLIIFLVVYLVFFLLQRLFHSIIDKLNLENADKALGLLLGFVEGAALVIFSVLVMSMLPIREVQTLLTGSVTGSILLGLLPPAIEMIS